MLELYDYDLPPELIAQTPAPQRDGSRLLVLDRARRSLSARHFPDLGEFLHAGDILVVNDARVFSARIRLTRGGGGSAELLFLTPLQDQSATSCETGAKDNDPPDHWEAIIRPARWARRFLESGETIELPPGRSSPDDSTGRSSPDDSPAFVRLLGDLGDGRFEVVILRDGTPLPREDVIRLCDSTGEPPLPPYIKRSLGDKHGQLDRERYQTVYAQNPVAIAAPTAGLHFTAALLEAIRARGVEVLRITHQVGIGTFQPLRGDALAGSELHAESSHIDAATGDRLLAARSSGQRIVAVGTTTVRALESFALAETPIPYRASTTLFIKPGHSFRFVDALITNFHLPQSSLLVLVSAFAGRELVLEAYRYAVLERFRFYSYGDAMLIL